MYTKTHLRHKKPKNSIRKLSLALAFGISAVLMPVSIAPVVANDVVAYKAHIIDCTFKLLRGDADWLELCGTNDNKVGPMDTPWIALPVHVYKHDYEY